MAEINLIKMNTKDIVSEEMRIISWNVNGVRAVSEKGFFSWLNNTKPDILCLQETKVQKSQLSGNLLQPLDYHACWNDAVQKGYSGTALFSRQKPLNIKFGLGIDEFDSEGRTIIAYYPDFILINCYFPNGGRDLSRVKFKLDFYGAFLEKCEQLRMEGNTIIFCGDVNTAHKNIDLSHPKPNEKKTGFLPEERAWLDKVATHGYIDTFRHFYPDTTEQYTWWSSMTNARERNIGWRLDYFFITKEAINRVTEATILSDVQGSDHCPVGIKLLAREWRKDIIEDQDNITPSQLRLF